MGEYFTADSDCRWSQIQNRKLSQRPNLRARIIGEMVINGRKWLTELSTHVDDIHLPQTQLLILCCTHDCNRRRPHLVLFKRRGSALHLSIAYTEDVG